MKRVSLKGVVIGNIVDIILTNIAVVLIVILIFILTPPEPAGDATATIRAVMASSTFWVPSFILGALCSALAGYVSAWIAKHDELLNGALSSILCVSSGVYGVFSGNALLHLALLPIGPVLGALGGYLYSRRNPKQQ